MSQSLLFSLRAQTNILWEQQKIGDFCEELLSENDFEAVLATFCCYDHGANSSEAVQKIVTDQK